MAVVESAPEKNPPEDAVWTDLTVLKSHRDIFFNSYNRYRRTQQLVFTLKWFLWLK